MPEVDMARKLAALAEDDAKALGVLLQSNEVPQRIAGFHAQQAVEKALKAWLVLLDVDFPLTHSLFALFALIREAGTECGEYERLAALTPYAVQLRYDVSRIEAEVDPADVASEVTELVAHVRGLVDAAEASGGSMA